MLDKFAFLVAFFKNLLGETKFRRKKCSNIVLHLNLELQSSELTLLTNQKKVESAIFLSDSKRLVPIGSKIVIINTNCEVL